MAQDKLYKYCSLDTAIKILESNSVILNNPDSFNDPFDSYLIPTKKSEKESFNLLLNYTFFDYLKGLAFDSDFSTLILQPLICFYDILMNRNKEFVKIPLLNTYYNIFNKIVYKQDFSNDMKDAKRKFSIEMKNTYNNIRDNSLITCFSKRNDSILMWSHYGDKHKGICFELKNNEELYSKVSYRNRRYKLNFLKIYRGYLYSQHKKCEYVFDSRKYKRIIMKAFLAKQKDWNYEKEIRCILFKGDKLKEFYQNGGNYFLKIDITKIYIGAKVKKTEDLDKLLEMASEKDIPVVYMKEDEKKFKIVPNLNKY